MDLGSLWGAIADLQGQIHRDMAGGLKALAELTMPGAAVALAMAFLFGALHAVMPGHGKVMLISYHLGRTHMGRASGVVHGLTDSALLIATHVGSAILLVAIGVALVEPGAFGRGGASVPLSTLSATLIIAVGVWLLFSAIRPHRHAHAQGGRLLAVATGLVPCPLTTVLMTYAAVQGIVVAGLFLSAAMALGMIATVAAFTVSAVLLRTSLLPWLSKTEGWRASIGKALEIAGAAAIVLLGLASFLSVR